MKNEKPAVVELYQSPEGVLFTQVSKEVGRVINSLQISIHNDEDLNPENMGNNLLQALKGRYWWFKEQWRQKGLPKEQLIIATPRLGIEIYNFSDKLTESEVQDFKTMVSIYSQINREMAYNTILINDEQPTNVYSGEPMRGEGSTVTRTIRIDPAAREEKPYRIPEVGNLLGTLVHEGAHPFIDTHIDGQKSADLISNWSREMGWTYDLDRRFKHPGGEIGADFVDDPSRCISEYAVSNRDDDFCESVVGAIFAPKRLDPQRLEFIRRELGLGALDLNTDNVVTVRREANRVLLPRVRQVFYSVSDARGMFGSIKN